MFEDQAITEKKPAEKGLSLCSTANKADCRGGQLLLDCESD